MLMSRQTVWIEASLLLAGMAGCAASVQPPLPEQTAATMIEYWTDWSARSMAYADVAEKAYRTHSKVPSDSPDAPREVQYHVSDRLSEWTGTTAYVVEKDPMRPRHRIVGIEGTIFRVSKEIGAKDFVDDARFRRVYDYDLGLAVHEGFRAVARAVREALREDSRLNRDMTIGVAGHSLGGAAGVLLAMYLEQERLTTPEAERRWGEVIEVITFGQPMFTDDTGLAAALTKSILAKLVRIVACDDVIPLLPGHLGRYAHAGAEILLLDAPHFETSCASAGCAFASARARVPVGDDFKNGLFHGHTILEYVRRLSEDRSQPMRWDGKSSEFCHVK